MMKRLLYRIASVWRVVWKQLKDWRNLAIFAIVLIVMSCEVWVPYLLGAITGDAYWFVVGSTCWAFWLAPFTPFLPLCVAITLGVRKLIDRMRGKHRGK